MRELMTEALGEKLKSLGLVRANWNFFCGPLPLADVRGEGITTITSLRLRELREMRHADGGTDKLQCLLWGLGIDLSLGDNGFTTVNCDHKR